MKNANTLIFNYKQPRNVVSRDKKSSGVKTR